MINPAEAHKMHNFKHFEKGAPKAPKDNNNSIWNHKKHDKNVPPPMDGYAANPMDRMNKQPGINYFM